MISQKQADIITSFLRSALPKEGFPPEAAAAWKKIVERCQKDGIAGTDIKIVDVNYVGDTPPPPPPPPPPPVGEEMEAMVEAMVAQRLEEGQAELISRRVAIERERENILLEANARAASILKRAKEEAEAIKQVELDKTSKLKSLSVYSMPMPTPKGRRR